MPQHQSILEFKRGRYFKLALLLCAAAVAAYAWHEPSTSQLKPYGGTWLGYTLGRRMVDRFLAAHPQMTALQLAHADAAVFRQTLETPF